MAASDDSKTAMGSPGWRRRWATLGMSKDSTWRRRWVAVLLVLASASLGLTEAPDLEPVTTRYVVGFHDFPAGMEVGDTYLGETIVHLDEVLRFVVVVTDDPADFEDQASEDPNARYAEEDEPILLLPGVPDGVPYDPWLLLEDDDGDVTTAEFSSNDPFVGSQYGPQQIRGPAAWDHTRGSTSAAVCIVDSGVRRSHEDIGSSRWLGWKDFVNGGSTPYDDRGHGTHVAGIAAAGLNNGRGIAGMGNVGIYGVKVLASNGSGTWSNVASAIRWCADNTMSRTVINLSFGNGGYSSATDDAVEYAYGKGRLLVGAAGNGSCSGCAFYPADFPEVISVGCVDGNRTRCGFSNRGPNVEAAAPGSSILSTYNGSNNSYTYKSGTSMSAPHVSGALALAWSDNTGLAAATLRARLQLTAVDLGSTGWDSSYGHGLVDAKCLVSATPHKPRSVVANAGPGAGQIRLTWSQPIHDCRASISAYRIYRATSSGGSYSYIGEVGGSTRTFTDSGLSNGVWRYYRIRAVNSRGASLNSNKASARTFTPPSEPRNVKGTLGPDPGQVTITWDPPSDNGGTSVTSYRVYRARNATSDYSLVASLGGNARSWTDDAGLLDAGYYYKVAARNVAGVGPQSERTCPLGAGAPLIWAAC
jgi:subtilisin family serine protease